MKATAVFTPGALPAHTYYDRKDLRLEWRLLDALETKGVISSVSGPSKSGKTVLCETVIGQRKMLIVTGGGVNREEVFWRKIRQKLGLPVTTSANSSSGRSAEFSGRAGGTVRLPLVASGSAEIGGAIGATGSEGRGQEYEGPDGTELLEHVAAQGYTLVVDDFHYIDRGVQKSLAEQFKEAARQGASIVVVSVSHRSDDAIRANPDLRGRVASIDIPYWRDEELRVIAEKGFPLLRVQPDAAVLSRFASESVSSPQLMQAICLQFCRDTGFDETQREWTRVSLSQEQVGVLLRNTTSLANCKTAFDILQTGPKPRGQERNMYKLRNGQSGDVYYVVLKALATGEPALTLPYATIKQRVEDLVPTDPPRGVGIIQALQQMGKAVVEKLGEDRVLEWDEDKEFLNVPDPYFLYYLRWSQW